MSFFVRQLKCLPIIFPDNIFFSITITLSIFDNILQSVGMYIYIYIYIYIYTSQHMLHKKQKINNIKQK